MANLHHIKFSHLIVLVPDAYTLRRRQSESALWPNQMEIVVLRPSELQLLLGNRDR